MNVIPVLDVMQGVVVRGVGGRRNEYRPVQSVLTASSDPLAVAETIRETLGLSEFYVADLDAIQFGAPQRLLIRQLAKQASSLWGDWGVREANDAADLLRLENVVAVIGLETVAGPLVLSELCARFGSERLVFSLDLKRGEPLGDLTGWPDASPRGIAARAVEGGVRRMIVLDLAQVGERDGVSTLPLCRWIKTDFPSVLLVTGGGVRHLDDLQRLRDAGMDGVLVASALHNGSINAEALRQFL